MENPKLALIPSGYKSGKVYSILPVNGVGDFDFSRNTESSRVNKKGLIETVGNNVPRLDWLNSDCPSLSLEPQRTNLVQYSEDITQSIWNKKNINYDSNVIAPSGGTNAFKIYPNTTFGEHYIEQSNLSTTQTTYSGSVFIKDGGTSVFEIIIVHVGIGSAISRATFTITNGVVNFNTLGGVIQSVNVKEFENGWYRCELKYNFSSSVSSHRIRVLPKNNAQYVGDNFSGVNVYGIQVEQGSYPTSYIKTIGSAVTRLIDNSHLLNQTLFTDYPFTVYAKAKIDAVGNTVFGLNNTSSNQYYLLFYFPNSSQVSVGRATIGFNDFDNYNFSYSVGDTIKVIITFISEIEYKLYINGNEIAHVTNGTSIPFNHDDISLGQLRITGDTGTRNSINEFRVYDRVLTEAEAIKLTTI